uniref:Uncharacterized protein n=1 Tax=Eutreptiella gymnastica TaxID=73025 RepID=A0A7S1IBR9_9EUGL
MWADDNTCLAHWPLMEGEGPVAACALQGLNCPAVLQRVLWSPSVDSPSRLVDSVWNRPPGSVVRRLQPSTPPAARSLLPPGIEEAIATHLHRLQKSLQLEEDAQPQVRAISDQLFDKLGPGAEGRLPIDVASEFYCLALDMDSIGVQERVLTATGPRGSLDRNEFLGLVLQICRS